MAWWSAEPVICLEHGSTGHGDDGVSLLQLQKAWTCMEAVSRPGASQEAKQLNFHFACVFGCYNHDGSNKKKMKKDGSFVLLHRPGIEPGSRPWQGRILPLDQRCQGLWIPLSFDAEHWEMQDIFLRPQNSFALCDCSFVFRVGCYCCTAGRMFMNTGQHAVVSMPVDDFIDSSSQPSPQRGPSSTTGPQLPYGAREGWLGQPPEEEAAAEQGWRLVQWVAGVPRPDVAWALQWT